MKNKTSNKSTQSKSAQSKTSNSKTSGGRCCSKSAQKGAKD